MMMIMAIHDCSNDCWQEPLFRARELKLKFRNRQHSLTHKRGHETPTSSGVQEAGFLEPLSAVSAMDYQLHGGWIDWTAASDGYLWRFGNFGHSNGSAFGLGW